jgi:antitoxin component of MazEF toxin-antitoxin module
MVLGGLGRQRHFCEIPKASKVSKRDGATSDERCNLRLSFDFPKKAVYTLVIHSTEDNTMQKMLIKHGNSLALVIDKPILELLQISIDTPLEISTDGDHLLVKPCRDPIRRKKLKDNLKKLNGKFSDDLRRLAE